MLFGILIFIHLVLIDCYLAKCYILKSNKIWELLSNFFLALAQQKPKQREKYENL